MASTIKAAFTKAKGRGKLQEKIYVGSLLLDLEATVNNRSIHKPDGDYAGRNPGIRGWIFENCIELLNSYTTLMHYKGIADKVKKEVGLEKSLTPIDIFLPDAQDTDVEMKPKLSTEEIASFREKLAALLKTNEALKSLDYFEALLFRRLNIRRYRSVRVRQKR